jgi:hypothetical protein
MNGGMPATKTYFSRFEPSVERGGGSRRVLQILEILRGLSIELISSYRSDRLDAEALRRIQENVQKKQDLYSRPGVRGKQWSDLYVPYLFRLREISREWSRSIPELSTLEIALLDDPIYFVPLLKHLKNLKIPVVAVCHHLEGLAGDRIATGPSLKIFLQEKALLSHCRLVITISEEEEAILRNLGIPCLYVPYYPVKPLFERLLAVRRCRSESEKKGILLLGSTTNSATREGMQKVIAHWRLHGLHRSQGKLLVAGFQTENLFPSWDSPEGVELLGTLTNPELEEVLSQAKACLCYQEVGAGALTRICEMLIAGLPVLANGQAARSYYGRKGLVEIRNLDDLESGLRRLDSLEEEIPLPARPEDRDLIRRIAKESRK